MTKISRYLAAVAAVAAVAGVLILAGCRKSVVKHPAPATNVPPKLSIAFMPRSKKSAYGLACKKGAEQAAAELGDDLLFNGPEEPDARKQNEMVDQWTAFGVDAIVISCENRESAAVALRKARRKGIHVITLDFDCVDDGREFLVSAVTPQILGATLMDEAGRLNGEQGEFAIITGSLNSATLNELRKCIEERLVDKYPQMKLVAVRPCNDSGEQAQVATTALLNDYPDLALVMTISMPGLSGAIEAVKQAGKSGVIKVIGLGLPSENQAWVRGGLAQSVILWKPADLGYLAIETAHGLIKGTLNPGDTNFNAGRLGKVEVKGDRVLLGKTLLFNRDNIDRFDF